MQSMNAGFNSNRRYQPMWSLHILLIIAVLAIDILMVYASYCALSESTLSVDASTFVLAMRAAGFVTLAFTAVYLLVHDDLALSSIYGSTSLMHLAVVLATDGQLVTTGLAQLL